MRLRRAREGVLVADVAGLDVLGGHCGYLAVWLEAAEPQGVGDDEEAGARHRGARDQRVQVAGGGQREGGDVVAERPEEVALDRRERAAREPDGIRARAQVARDERDVGGLDRDVRAGADREAEIGLRERRGIVDAVADHRDDAALVLQPADDSGLVLGQDVGDHLGDPHLGGDGAGRRGVVAGQEHRPQPERA